MPRKKRVTVKEELEAAETLASLAMPRMNMPEDMLTFFKKTFYNMLELLVTEKGKDFMTKFSLELRVQVGQHFIDLATIIDRMIAIGGLPWSEEHQNELTIKWTELAKKVVSA